MVSGEYPPKEVFPRHCSFLLGGKVRVENRSIDEPLVLFVTKTYDKYNQICLLDLRFEMVRFIMLGSSWSLKTINSAESFLVAPLGLLQDSSNEDVPRMPLDDV